jgi:serine/threonine-protein kinase RsbW
MKPPEAEPLLPVALTIPADARWLTVVRLTVSGVASRVGASYEDVDDIKVAVSEACTNAIDHAFRDDAATPPMICVQCHSLEGAIRIEVSDEGCGFDPAQATVGERAADGERQGGLGLYLIGKLMDEMEVVSRPGGGTKVVMVKRFARE